MLCVNVVRNVPINLGTPLPGINEAGTMALSWGDGGTVYGRGLLNGGPSCIFRGQLDSLNLTVEDVVLSPSMRPKTDDGKEVHGFEDPTYLGKEHNFFGSGEDDRTGILCTEAYWKTEERRSVGTNLLYIDESGALTTVLTPSQVEEKLQGAVYGTVDMVKEANLLTTGFHGPHLLMELGTAVGKRQQSRLAICKAQESPSVIRPFLEPVDGTWFDNHTSTVAHDFRLRDGLALLVFNGAKRVESKGKRTNRWAVGLGLLNGDNHLFWWTGEPVITPPEGIEPGPGGQLIAFGSDARLTEQAHGVWTLEILYHAMDRYPCLLEATISLG